MKKELFWFFYLWAQFGFFRVFMHFKGKGKLRAKTNDAVFFTLILPYMLSVAVATLEFEVTEIKINFLAAIIGLVLFFAGSVIQLVGLSQLKNQFSNAVELQQNHCLVRSGIYGKIRHPIYLGILLQGISTLLLLNVKIAGIFVIWSIVGIILRIKKEENYLSVNLPGYASYIKETNALLPGIF